MFSQQNLHFLFPIISILLFVLPSLVFNDQLNTYPNEYSQQPQQREAQPDSSRSSSEVSYDTKSFVEDDTVPAAFNWDSNGVRQTIELKVKQVTQSNNWTLNWK